MRKLRQEKYKEDERLKLEAEEQEEIEAIKQNTKPNGKSKK